MRTRMRIHYLLCRPHGGPSRAERGQERLAAEGRFSRVLLACVAAALLVAACGRGPFKPRYEYEEELTLALDGTATLNVNASVAALVALRGAPLTTDPEARLDRGRVRELFAGPGVEVASVSLSRREGRRFVHVRIDVTDVRQLTRVPFFSWSRYRLDTRSDVVEYRQDVGAPAGRGVGEVGWTGEELVAFRMHLPSKILFEDSPGTVERGNIVEWEQPLAERLNGTPLTLRVNMEPETILYTTLILFGATIVAAAITFALVIWLVRRRGRDADPAASRP